MGWLIFLAVIVAIALLPVGVRLQYNADGFFLSFLLGHVKIKLFPRDKKAKKKQKKKEPKSKGKTGKTVKKTKAGKWTDFLPLVELGIGFFGAFRRKIRINHLDLSLILAGDDPCDLALNYGKAWTAVGNLMPLLEQVFVIKKRNIQVQCDFSGDTTRICAGGDITITVGRAIALLVYYGVKALRIFYSIQKMRKGGTEK